VGVFIYICVLCMKRIKLLEMKKVNLLLVLALLTLVFFNSCKKDKEEIEENKENILPGSWGVGIPDAISNVGETKNLSTTQSDTLNGNDIYENLRTFIAVGEGASAIVNAIITTISVHNINEPMSLTYTSDEDGRAKHLEVIENSTFDGQNWEFQMTISDAGSQANADGGNGLQVFWNQSPVKGIAILKPYNINRTDNANAPDALFKIAYSEAGENGYNEQMTVEVIGLPDINNDIWYMNSLKMFAGKTGNIVNVYGNSDHPNAYFFDSTAVGYDWAFVASANEVTDIAVAEVGLPRNNLNSTDRAELLVTNSIHTVFNDQIVALGYAVQQDVDNYLFNTAAPGYFNHYGFIQGGTAPIGDYNPLENSINTLSPYNPTYVRDLTISFK